MIVSSSLFEYSIKNKTKTLTADDSKVRREEEDSRPLAFACMVGRGVIEDTCVASPQIPVLN